MTPTSAPWTGRPSVRLFLVPPSQRLREGIDIGFVKLCKSVGVDYKCEAQFKKHIANWWVDPTQSIKRTSRHSGMLGTATRKSLWYSFGEDRALCDRDFIRLLGWNDHQLSLEGLAPNQLRDLAGEAMSVPCATVCAYALLHSTRLGLWA